MVRNDCAFFGILIWVGSFGYVGCFNQVGNTNWDSDSEIDSDTDTETEFKIDPDIPISNVTVSVHDFVKTMLVLRWDQLEEADDTHIRFTFENNEWYRSLRKSGEVGQHEEVVLGVPENTEVAIHILNRTGDEEVGSTAYMGTTGAVPSRMPRAIVESYNEQKASKHRWLLGVVTGASEPYRGPFWIFIIDRLGRTLWYYSNLGENPIIAFPRVSRDNKYIFFPNRQPRFLPQYYEPGVIRLTLDWAYYEEILLNLSDNADMTDDGSILYNTPGDDYYGSLLEERTPDGKIRTIWDCSREMGRAFFCYSNTINWNPLDDTVLMSFPNADTVLEIDRKSGDMVGIYGDPLLGYKFDPSWWQLGYPHFPVITPTGTLMVSTHMPDGEKHGFAEFEIHRATETLVEKWYFDDGDKWPTSMGEAHPVENGDGHIIANYGTEGVIKEITRDKEVVWTVRFDKRSKKMVGHTTLIDDLYALCRGF